MTIVTWNPLDKSSNVVLYNNNMNANTGTSFGQIVRATSGAFSGKLYFEIKIIGGNVGEIGIAKSTIPLNTDVRSSIDKRGYRPSNGYITSNSASGAPWLDVPSTTGDVVGVLVDFEIGEMAFYKNGNIIGTAFNDIANLGEVYPYVLSSTSSSSSALDVEANFGATDFIYIPNDLPYDTMSYDGSQKIKLSKILILSNNKVISVKPTIDNSNIIPEMTSNKTPIGIVDASSYSGSSYPYLAFNGSVLDGNGWVSNGNSNQWLSYQFTVKKRIISYFIYANNSGIGINAYPKDWTFEGSNDGIEWVVLDTRTNFLSADWIIESWNHFDFINENNYLRYRINVTSNNGNNSYIKIQELRMREYIEGNVKLLPSYSERNFINHGMSKSDVIDLSFRFKKKHFVEQSSDSLGNGKLFKKQIDTSEMQIKKVEII